MDAALGSAIQVAGWRLERALSRLEGRIARRLAGAEAKAEDHDRLAAELRATRTRAQDLEVAGAAAAAALDRAINQINEVLAEQGARA
ncbi:MAG TPA: DUF4164 family protein [Caulobacteraceae bacterium]|nr:DUF4164 family protein [Caulobacteraceae bacterium]